MVINPKNSQDFVNGLVDLGLKALFKGAGRLGRSLGYDELGDYLNDAMYDRGVSRRQVSRLIYDLGRRGYIQRGESNSIILTDKAKMKIVDQLADEVYPDEKHYLISFDIPEIKRKGRNNFRRAIKRMGFRQIQKSLWVHNKDLGELVEAAAEEYGVSDYVAYFVSEHSNIEILISKIMSGEKRDVTDSRVKSV